MKTESGNDYISIKSIHLITPIIKMGLYRLRKPYALLAYEFVENSFLEDDFDMM